MHVDCCRTHICYILSKTHIMRGLFLFCGRGTTHPPEILEEQFIAPIIYNSFVTPLHRGGNRVIFPKRFSNRLQ